VGAIAHEPGVQPSGDEPGLVTVALSGTMRRTKAQRTAPPLGFSRTIGARPGRSDAGSLGLEVTALLGSCLVVWWLSAVVVNPNWSWLALAQFLWLCLLCFRWEPQGFALFLPIAITRASVVVALIAVEYGARLPEVGLSGTPGPHTTSYVFLTALLFTSYLAAFGALRRAMRWREDNVLTATFDRYAVVITVVILAAAAGATLWLCAIGALRGFPLLAGVDRFVFRRLYADNLTLNILNCKSLVSSALGLVSFCLPVARTWKHAAAVTCLVFIGVNFLFGDKFFIILVTASCFFAPYLYLHHRVVRQRIGFALGVSAMLMAPVLGVTWFIYSDQGRASVEATSQRLTDRFAAQGELWYLQNKIGAPPAKWNGQFVAGNIEAMSVKNVDLFALQHGLGPAYFMNLYSPDKIRAAQGRHGGVVTYTMALEPLDLANFGWAGVFAAMVLTGALFALVSLYAAYAIERRLILSTIFSGYIMLLMRSFSSQGGPWVVASVFTLKWLSIVLAIELALLLLAASQKRERPHRRRGQRMSRDPRHVARRSAGS
jgi:hypothetical protein